VSTLTTRLEARALELAYPSGARALIASTDTGLIHALQQDDFVGRQIEVWNNEWRWAEA
jgi:hypothetical protein